MKAIILALALFVAVSLATDCQHGSRTQPLQFLKSTAVKSSHLFSKSFLSQQTYENIRIYADYSNMVNGTASQKDYIQNQLMPNAISYFQETLKIIRLTTNVKGEMPCYGLTPPAYLANTGVAADLVILVGTENDGSSGPRAISGTCGLSQVNNRPSFGSMIFNLDLIDLQSVPLQEQFLVTTMHELTHILGFSKPVYPYFIDPTTGQKLTNHIRFKMVNQQNITIMDTPPLTAKIREYFNCPTIEGAYLEDEGGAGNAGTHFERRIFQNELMVGNSRIDQVVSFFTLSMLEGTGWYKPNYNMIEEIAWGEGEGCGFYYGPCVAQGGVPLYPEYCAPLTQRGCSFNGRGKGFCGAFPGQVQTDANLAAKFDYWGNKTVVGYKFNDNCPVYNYYANSDCEDPLSAAAGIAGEVFGSSSRCFTGTLGTKSASTTQKGFCFSVNCTLVSSSPKKFSLSFTSASGATVQCLQAGKVSVPGFAGKLDCPDPFEFCYHDDPNYCERGCMGKGTCTNGKCSCIPGWTGSDCGSRLSSPNCPRCASNAANKTCYGDQCVA